jgi:hypothetical protein
MIDLDNGFKIEKAEKRLKRFNYNYALITSRSHSPNHHKYHIIIPSQYPIFSVDAYRCLEKEIVEKLFPESDQVVKDAGRFFYGSPGDAHFSLNLDGMDYPMIDEDIWDSSLLILDENGQETEAGECTDHTSIYCPFHDDKNPSAFLDYSAKSNNYYIVCSACSKTFWKRKDEISLEDRCVPFWSIGQNIIETGISNGTFFMEKIGEKKFYILSKTHQKKEKATAYRYLVENKHISHLTRVNYLADITADKDSYKVDIFKGVINVHIAPIAVKKKDNLFIENYLGETFGQYKDYVKQWLSVYTYTNYRKLPTNIFKGVRGTSKSTFAEMVGEIYKPLSSEWHGHEQNFTYEVEKKLLIVEENEISSMNQYKTLKKYSGQKYSMVNKKFQDPYEVRNNMNIILLANDNVPLYVNREEMPSDEKNNQFFVYELPEVNKERRRADMQKMLVDRLGHYIRTELKDVFDSVTDSMDFYRYSISTPITDAEIDLFNDNMTESESYSDSLIQKLVLMEQTEQSERYGLFIAKGYLPVDLIKMDFELGSHYSAIIKNLKKRRLVAGNADKKQIGGNRFFCYAMTNKMIGMID